MENRSTGERGYGSLLRLAFLLLTLLTASATAQETPQPKEQFIPADQLDVVFDRDRRGVMMKREELRVMLEQARANAASRNIPIPIITEYASLAVTPSDQQAQVTMELKIRQYAEGWQVLRIRAGNLFVEKIEIDGQPAIVGRDSADPTALFLAHEHAGEFTAVVSMSTQLATLGSDRAAAFELPVVPAVQLTVHCPAGRHLLVNDQQLDRPAPDDAATDYVIPVGNAADVRLRWVVQRKETEAQTLVFVRTDGQLKVQKETLRWESDSRISVFGGTINKVVARVPARLEVTSVESTGLEAWTLEDDPDHAGYTRVTLTYRQPFTNDRLVRIRAVAATGNGAVEETMQKIPTLSFAEVTVHTGRLVVTHEDGLRLVSETGSGIRRMSAAELGLSTEASVFDFWMQEFALQVAARPRDRELFVESSAVLAIDDTTATFDASIVVETLNAPLFELSITIPADWQLTAVESEGTAVPWTAAGDPSQILIRPVQAIAPGQLMTLVLKMTRTIADPDSEQKLALPVVTATETTTVGGTYIVRFADDLIVAPLSLTGLTPVAGSGTEQVFQNLGTTVSGELSIVRKPSRLASRAVLKTWADSRQQSLDAEIITDVLNGTIRTLTIRLSESLGPDVRFEVRSVGPVPGMQQTRAIHPVTIIEQSAGTPADGLRPFVLKLDHRFAGSLSLHAFVQQPRSENENTPIAAPVVQVQDAVRQQGVLVFEASPEQQLSVGPEVRLIPGLFVADAGLVDAPATLTGRRVALVYRFVQPGYAFQVNETRFVTNAVPSAVCTQLANVCTLNDSGSIQRWCQAKIRSSGVQTLRFTLPDGDSRSFLWSTMLNGEPVEVRRDAGDYLVAVPTNSESQEHLLTVLFESDASNAGTFGQTDQGPVQFSIDAGEQRAIPIDVLHQSWRVYYPQSSLLVDSDGQFRPTNGVDQPGWLISMGEIVWPETSELAKRLIPLIIFLLVLFVVTVMVSRHRWKTLLAAVTSLILIFVLFTFFSVSSQERSASSYFGEVAKTELPSPDYLSDDIQFRQGSFEIGLDQDMPQASTESMAVEESLGMIPTPALPGGMGGGMGGGGFGGGMAPGISNSAGAIPGSAPNFAPQSGVAPTNDPFNMPQAPVAAGGEQGPNLFESVNRVDAPGDDFQQLAGMSPPMPQKKGSARLSVNVNLDVPWDYQAREFVSVADAVHQPSVLSIVVQRRRQIAAIRFVAALIVILLAWRMRSAVVLWKLTLAITMLLIALGLSPLLSNAWQSVVDGVALGALVSVAMALVCSGCSCCPWLLTLVQRSPAFLKTRPSKSAMTSTLLVITMMSQVAQAVGQEAPANESIRQPDLVVPYSPDEPALRAERVFIRHDDFLKLYQQANPDALKSPSVSPLGSAVVASFFRTSGLTPVDGSKQVLGFEARFVIWSDSDQLVNVPLPLGPVAIRSLKVDGREGSVQPLVVGAQVTEIQNFSGQQIPQQQRQQEININAAMPATEGPAYAVQVTGKGLHVVDLTFEISALVEGELGRADLPLRSAASGTLEWMLPADGLDAKVNGRTNVYRREGRTIILPIALLSTVRLQWLPAVQKVAGDVVLHSTVASALVVQDSGLVLRTTVSVTVRQGEIPELEITIPEGYSVQSVTGDDVAGWTAQSTDATRSVKLQLRRTVSDGTKVTMQLFAPVPTTEALASLAVPISMVRGASRDLGTVILKTGSQFQVRSDSLSGVTQINPGDAPVPEGEELSGRPMLAWRYTRHPASVIVKVTPTADELTVESMHAVRLEEQRQLWSSRMTLQVTGAPRSRIDVAVPRNFLALDVTATALKDWYFVEEEDADGDLRTLSIQLLDARTGQLQIAIQGQMNRDADRSVLKLQPPTVLNSTKTNSELAVWLDAASESVGLENGSDWMVKSTAAVSAGYQEISPMAPSLAFQSAAARPGAFSLKLRQAVSTLIAESVTVTNVTETALEITVALNWQIARAAADLFAVELPSSVASIMTFDVPGQRRVTREDLGNGRTRVTMQLQQPVTDRLFVLGTASLPLPIDRVIRTDVPSFVVPLGAASTLSGEGHFWVLVNQSNGLLEPTAEQPEDKVSPEQITTQIPQELLQQAVAVKKLRPETAAWNLVYPEQHQVAPAVVTLATHTTVISDDGSWRSRHQLQVTNESRQFLPVVLPGGSRLMYCLVQGRPSRVVIRGEGSTLRHLIPIPQSGALASGFEVEFALAGRFDDSAGTIRKEWTSRRLLIPVPTFPEFREDPEYGISVSRNRWSVYVPESWRATLVEDPEVTNVVRAASTELQDASLLSEVEQASILLNNVKAAKGNYQRSKAYMEVQNATEKLRRYSGNDSGVEQQRGDVLNKLSDIISDFGSFSSGQMGGGQQGQQRIAPPITGNDYLYEQELGQNSLNFSNNDAFFRDNGRGVSNLSNGQQQPQQNPDEAFRFRIPIQDESKSMDKSGKESGKDKPAEQPAEEKSEDGKRQSRALQEQRESSRVQGEGKADAKDGEEMDRTVPRSQLMKRRGSQAELGKQLAQEPQNPNIADNFTSESTMMSQLAVPQQMDDALNLQVMAAQEAERSATPTGLLSLRFDIPTDGHQIDFLRGGGNPALSLDVRSSDFVTKGTGLIWLVLCGFGIVLLLGPGRRGQTHEFCQRLFLILAIAGLAAWLMTRGDLRAFGLLCCVGGSIGFAVITAIRHLRAAGTTA